MINFIVWIIVGGVCGALAGMIMRDNNSMLMNVIVGIVGAGIAGFIFGRGADINTAGLSITSFLYSLLGAVILLAIVNLIRRGTVR